MVRKTFQSSGSSRRISVAEDEDLQRPADADRAPRTDPKQFPLRAREPGRPGAARDHPRGDGGHARERTREEKRAERKQPDRVREVALPHVGERTGATAERARMAGQIKEGTRRPAQGGRLQDEAQTP